LEPFGESYIPENISEPEITNEPEITMEPGVQDEQQAPVSCQDPVRCQEPDNGEYSKTEKTADNTEGQGSADGAGASQNSRPEPDSAAIQGLRPNPVRHRKPLEPRKPSQGSGNGLSNGMKVLLTVIFTIIPGFGQLAGIITAIIFMNSEDDEDKKSFGVAILVASLIMFVLACIGCFIAILAASSMRNIGSIY